MALTRSLLQIHEKLLGICKPACFRRRMALKQAALPGSRIVSMTQRQSPQRAPAVARLKLLTRPLSEGPQQVREAQHCVLSTYLKPILWHLCWVLKPVYVHTELGQSKVSLYASAPQLLSALQAGRMLYFWQL